MPRQTRGYTYPVRGGVGIRWQHDSTHGRNPGPFRNKTQAHRWFDEHVAPAIRRGGLPPTVTFDQFCVDYLDRWGADVTDRTRTTVTEWLAPARRKFGRWTLTELEGATDEIARWRSTLPTAHARYKHTRAVRQVLAAAVRWGYITRNPAKDMGANPTPRTDEVQPFTPLEIDAIAAELADSARDMAIVIFAAQTGLRTNEWAALQGHDIDRRNQTVAVARRFAHGQATPYPKTERRAVPLTPAALDALELLPAPIGQTVLFPGRFGDPLNLNNWATRIWTPALQAAGIRQRGPYHLRHTFATQALRAGVSIFELSRLMGASVATIERHYAHLASDSLDHVRDLLTGRRQ
jgi:integrase